MSGASRAACVRSKQEIRACLIPRRLSACVTLGDEAWKEISRRGIAESARRRTGQKRARSKYAPNAIADPKTIGHINLAISFLLAARLETGEPNLPLQGWGCELFARIYAIDDRETALDHLEEMLAQRFPAAHRSRLLEEAENARRRVRELFAAGKIPLRFIPDNILSKDDLRAFGMDGDQDGRTVTPFTPAATEASRRYRERS